jgi:N-acetylglucosamine-6-phosphate deacetylase
VVSTIAATQVLTEHGIVGPAAVVVDGGVIVAVEPFDRAPDRIVAPGFIDLQVNGVDDVDCAVAEGADWSRIGALLAQRGTTSWCPTLVTAPLDRYAAALQRIADAMTRALDESLPEILGAHLEGPFLGAAAGAHPPHLIRGVDRDFIASLPSTVRLVTLAPEADDAAWAAKRLRSQGVTVSIGHTRASHGEYQSMVDAGAGMVTHLFNAMSGVHHREGGVALWALTDPRVVAGLIADGVHVDPYAIALAFTAKGADGIVLVTDSVAWRSERFAARSLAIVDGAPRLRNGTIAGSTLTMDAAVRTCVSAGVPLPAALTAASTTPATIIGANDRGILAVGKRADLVVLDTSLNVLETWSAGRLISRRG